MWAGIVVAVVLALWSTAGAWGSLPPHGEDVMSYLVRADFALPQLVAHGRLDGWFPRFYLGYQEFLFNGPGVTWAMAAARGVTFGLLSDAGALKVAGVLSFAALPVAMAFLARSLGLERLAAGVAAVLSLLVSSQFGPGLQGLYAVGLVSHQLGAPIFCVALGALLRVPRDARRRWVLLGAVSLAALAITHIISVMILAVVFPLLAIGLRRELLSRAALTRFALTGLLAAALAAWWLVPALAHRDLRGPVATWSTPPFGERVGDIVNGRILFRPYTIWIVVAGWVYALFRVRHRRPFAIVLVAVPLVYLVIAHWAASRWPDQRGRDAARQPGARIRRAARDPALVGRDRCRRAVRAARGCRRGAGPAPQRSRARWEWPSSSSCRPSALTGEWPASSPRPSRSCSTRQPSSGTWSRTAPGSSLSATTRARSNVRVSSCRRRGWRGPRAETP